MHIKLEDFSEESLRKTLLKELGIKENEFDEQENLLDYGLNSMDIMFLVAALSRHNSEVNYLSLISNPTYSAWRDIIFQNRIT